MKVKYKFFSFPENDNLQSKGVNKIRKNITKTSKNKRNDEYDVMVQCENCEKVVNKNFLLKHIGQRQKCKDFYGVRYDQLRQENRLKTWQRYNKNPLTLKHREERAKLQKEARQRKKQENIALAKKGLNWLAKENEPEDPRVKESEMQCEFCRMIFPLSSILIHISNTEECKLFYGARLEDLKKSHKMQRMRFYREEEGIELELIKQKRRYNTNSEAKKKKKEYHELKLKTQMKNRKEKNVPLAMKGLNINSKEKEAEDPEVKKSNMRQCEFCKEIFEPYSVLIHIAKTEACKIFYGPRLEEMKEKSTQKNTEESLQKKEWY